MTIVASNSLTLSNVNDGTITHIAYAYSADGTDRFTTVYPNLNLLSGTSYKTQINDNHYMTMPVPTTGGYLGNNYISANYINGTPGTVTDWARFYIRQQAVPDFQYIQANTTYTVSLWARGSGTSSIYVWSSVGAVSNPATANKTINLTNVWQLFTLTFNSASSIPDNSQIFIRTPAGSNIDICLPKLEQGSTATPWMPSSSEVTTADWPSYIGQYTDFTQADSTNPSDYTWSLIRGNDGADGQDGKDGTNGKDGDPGKVVSDTEPTTRFKGLTWKYSGASDLTASDGTVIKPNTEYYYNGTNWMINYLSANNLEANSITADLIDAKNLTITDGEFVSTTTNGQVSISTEIKDNHIIISKTDGTVNTRNDIALDSEQGLAQKFTNINTGFYRLAGINFQGPFISDSDGNYAQLTPRGTDLSTDVPWTNLTLASGFSIGSGGKARYRVKNGVLYIHFRKIVCPAITGNQPNTLCYVPANGRASDGYDSFGVMSATNSTRIQYNDSGDGKVAIVPASNTTAGQGFNGFLICPMD